MKFILKDVIFFIPSCKVKLHGGPHSVWGKYVRLVFSFET